MKTSLGVPSRLEVLAIGDELLDGRVVDTNTLRLATALREVGITISQRATVTDDTESIASQARAIASRGCDLCIVSGGLGPTRDDVTAAAFAQLARVELVRDAEQVRIIEERLISRGRTITENQRKQADRPSGAAIIDNHQGSAPGFRIEFDGCTFLCVPGVPLEFDAMIEAALISPLRSQGVARETRLLRCFGLAEAQIDARLESIATEYPSVRQGFRVDFPEIQVTLSSVDVDALDAAFVQAESVLQDVCFSTDGRDLAGTLLQLLREKDLRLVVAESCTGGLIGDRLTDVPGASETFWGTVGAYSNQAKIKLLHVKPDSIEQHGAVSEQVVLEMAQGACRVSGAECSVAVSGIAGPDGGTCEKPVGTVFVAISGPFGSESRRFQFRFERRRNKIISVYHALDLLRRRLRDESSVRVPDGVSQ